MKEIPAARGTGLTAEVFGDQYGRERRTSIADVGDTCRYQAGFFVAMIPAELSEEEVEAGLHELGVEAEAVLELGGWRTSGSNVAVARVPFPMSARRRAAN